MLLLWSFAKIQNQSPIEERQGSKFSCEKLLLEEHSPRVLQHDAHVTNHDDSQAEDSTDREAAS